MFQLFDKTNCYLTITINDNQYRCSIGKSGVVENKKEGDNGTPLGSFKIRQFYYRPDKITLDELKTTIPCIPLTKDAGWCDDSNSLNYNQFITLPSNDNHEKLWRNDDVYDVIGVLSYNDTQPIIAHAGSAIFLHIARENYAPTAGCIALCKDDLLKLISQLSKDDEIMTTRSGDCRVLKHSTNQPVLSP
jgi:L,D-peptidoglycan transpeptidase YkuD (ErfK/YbiS/YcfS/YnhG family)